MASEVDSRCISSPDSSTIEEVVHQQDHHDSLEEHDDEKEKGSGPAHLKRIKERISELDGRRGRALTQLCRELESAGRPPLRVVIVGKHGAGKSSFINTVGAAFSGDTYREHAYTGDHGGAGTPISIFTKRFERCCNPELYCDVPLPTLIDVAGKMDTADTKMELVLRLLIYGHIKEETSIMAVHKFCEEHTQEEILNEYSQSYRDMKVDRVVFVASAADKLPDKLMECVRRAARPGHEAEVKRSIPVFGVLTKLDKINTVSQEYLDVRKAFIHGLGLNEDRLLCCSNYCDEKGKRLDPNVDVPVIEFIQKLCGREYIIIADDEELPGTAEAAERRHENGQTIQQLLTFWRGLDLKVQAVVTSVAVTLTLWLALYLLFVLPFSGGVDDSLRVACKQGLVKDQATLDACSLPPTSSPQWWITVLAFTAGVGCLSYMFLTMT